MSTASNPQSYQNPAWGGRQWQGPAWPMPPYWHSYHGVSRPFGIAMTILGFILWWPVGLALLFFMIFSGRVGCRGRRWAMEAQNNQGQGNSGWQASGTQPSGPPWGNWANWCGGGRSPGAPSSGNHAFDEYRAETLRRLEEEQTEFSGFLERLRFAKDKAEFDQFMAERRQAPRPPSVPDEPSHG